LKSTLTYCINVFLRKRNLKGEKKKENRKLVLCYQCQYVKRLKEFAGTSYGAALAVSIENAIDVSSKCHEDFQSVHTHMDGCTPSIFQ